MLYGPHYVTYLRCDAEAIAQHYLLQRTAKKGTRRLAPPAAARAEWHECGVAELVVCLGSVSVHRVSANKKKVQCDYCV